MIKIMFLNSLDVNLSCFAIHTNIAGGCNESNFYRTWLLDYTRGQGGSSPVEQAGVTFWFSNSAGARENLDTTVVTGQFSEFLFTTN